jgi:hypothetical protein
MAFSFYFYDHVQDHSLDTDSHLCWMVGFNFFMNEFFSIKRNCLNKKVDPVDHYCHPWTWHSHPGMEAQIWGALSVQQKKSHLSGVAITHFWPHFTITFHARVTQTINCFISLQTY